MSGTKRARGPVDDQPSVTLVVHPWLESTTVSISVHRRDVGGRSGGRVAYWHLDLSRSDLTGLGTDDVLRLICVRLLRHIESGDGPGDYRATAVGPGAPVGATGATVTQDRLPGL